MRERRDDQGGKRDQEEGDEPPNRRELATGIERVLVAEQAAKVNGRCTRMKTSSHEDEENLRPAHGLDSKPLATAAEPARLPTWEARVGSGGAVATSATASACRRAST